MSRIWSMMDVGRRSLQNSQTALQTTAHNVANKSTEGYSRQRVDLTTNLPIGEGKLRIGMGARAAAVSRTTNQFLEKQIEREGGISSYYTARSEMLSRVENVYNEQVNKGLNHSMGNYFNSWRELSNNPESLATRTQVKESADYLAKDFQGVHRQLTDIQRDADYRITMKVTEINSLTKEIANLNEKIQMVETSGAPANDERDRRDVLLKHLGEKINIRYAESKDGQLTITAGNTAVLVSGYSQRDLEVGSTPARDGKREGNVDILYRGNPDGHPHVVTDQMTGGEIGGLLNVRDQVCNEFIDDMDAMAFTITTETNRAHMAGYDRSGRTGNLFFDQPLDYADAAANMKVTDEVMSDVSRVTAAGVADAPGDNRIANIMSNLQYKPMFNDGESTVDDFYNSLVGKIGIETQRAASSDQSQKDSLGQLKNLRESISGVSVDEEMTKMIEFQKSFDASARLIRTADEMMDTVLNLKRL